MSAHPVLPREPIAYEEMRRILGLIDPAMPFPDRDPLYSGIERDDWCVATRITERLCPHS